MSINLYPAQIESLYIHRVGNKARSEGATISKNETHLTDEMNPLIKEFFFKPFRDKEETYYEFVHEVDLEFHKLADLTKRILTDKDITFWSYTVEVARHLYEQHSHPHIKPGELYVAHISNILVDNLKTDAIGIFKSELRHDFLQFESKGDDVEVILQSGVSLGKLDKGCIIIPNESEGFKILSIDSNRYDTKYWLEDFLGVDIMADENFYTKKYLSFCQEFGKEVVRPREDKKAEVAFMNRAVNHFAKNDHFEEEAFMGEVMDDSDLASEFQNYKLEKAPKYSLEDVSSFDISSIAVTAARKKVNGLIELDTHIKIKLDFINPESFDAFVEKGWDEEKQMYYYLLYFNKEIK